MKKMKVLPPLRAVYASDVLYDPEAVDHLVQLLSKLRPLLLCDDNAKIEVYIAQKMRGKEAVHVPQVFKDFRPELAREENNVKVWHLLQV